MYTNLSGKNIDSFLHSLPTHDCLISKGCPYQLSSSCFLHTIQQLILSLIILPAMELENFFEEKTALLSSLTIFSSNWPQKPNNWTDRKQSERDKNMEKGYMNCQSTKMLQRSLLSETVHIELTPPTKRGSLTMYTTLHLTDRSSENFELHW